MQRSRSRVKGPFSGLLMMVVAAAVLIITADILQLRVTLTDSSAPAGIYRVVAAPSAHGELVAVCLPADMARLGLARGYLHKGDCVAGAEPLAKVMGALPGDAVEVEPDWVAVNGSRFANSRTASVDSHGRPLAHVPAGVRRVRSGEVWLFGFNNTRSWDARYFGPVPLANVRGALEPLVTW